MNAEQNIVIYRNKDNKVEIEVIKVYKSSKTDFELKKRYVKQLNNHSIKE